MSRLSFLAICGRASGFAPFRRPGGRWLDDGWIDLCKLSRFFSIALVKVLTLITAPDIHLFDFPNPTLERRTHWCPPEPDIRNLVPPPLCTLRLLDHLIVVHVDKSGFRRSDEPEIWPRRRLHGLLDVERMHHGFLGTAYGISVHADWPQMGGLLPQLLDYRQRGKLLHFPGDYARLLQVRLWLPFLQFHPGGANYHLRYEKPSRTELWNSNRLDGRRSDWYCSIHGMDAGAKSKEEGPRAEVTQHLF